MGGLGSGNWCRTSSKGTTEAAKRIDIRKLKIWGYLEPGALGTLSWTWGGEPSGSIGFRTECDKLVLTYRHQKYGSVQWEDIEYEVYFSETPCNYGGCWRKWFQCPGQDCGKRVAVLYQGGKYFLCRHCQNLAYSSQNEGRAQRASRKSRTIIEKLGGDPYGDRYPEKPKGMHWKTYDRLSRQAEFYENLSWHYMGQWLSRLNGPIGSIV